MTWTLVRKELSQHGLAFGLLSAGTMCGYLMIILATVMNGQAGSAFEALRLFVLMMGLLAAVLLGHRLVVLEYQERTQLFLEGLPLARWRMIAVKYALGLFGLLCLVGVAFLIACALAWRREALTGKFLAIVAMKAISVIWFTYNFCFLMGLMGRYRVALYLAIILSVALFAEQTQLQVARFGPAALLDGRFAYESDLPPWQALGITWGLGLGFLLLTATLSLIREGSVAALLAQKMSHREKVFIAALLVGLVWAGTLSSEKTKKAPFDLYDAVTETQPGVVVKVAASSAEDQFAAQRLAHYVATELSGARDYLGLERLPPVFITRRRDLDPNRFERGELEKAEGVHVHANFESKQWNAEQFQVWLLREVLLVVSEERVKLETKRWVLDGFPLFWTLRARAQAPLASDPTLALRALYGTAQGFSPADLHSWLRFRERVGDEIACGVAWSGLKTLARQQGAGQCRRFLRSVLGTKQPKDFRAVVHEHNTTFESQMLQKAGIGLQPFFASWQSELALTRQALAAELAQLPRLQGEVHFLSLSADSRKVRYRAKIERPPAETVRYSFLYHLLPAYDEEVDPKSIQRLQNRYPEQAEDELPETYSCGSRLYSTFALEVPALGCQVISGWMRQEVK